MPTKPDHKKNVKYTSLGTREECVQKGFGAGVHTERAKYLHEDSLQHIKYVGEVFEKHFKARGIADTKALLKFARGSNKAGIQKLVISVSTKKDGKIDHRAYNHILLWLYNNGIDSSKIPSCEDLLG
jgi:hypothetical protein